MSDKPLTPMENASLDLPTADRSNRCALDRAIRKLGYSILSRPDDGEPLWTRNGFVYKQSKVIRRHRTLRGEFGPVEPDEYDGKPEPEPEE